MNGETYTLEIFLTKEAIREAQELGNQSYEYKGPTFKEVEMTRTDDGFLTVVNKDGSFYLFPASRIARVKGKPNE